MSIFGRKKTVFVDSDILAIDGDLEYGEYLASECMTCHREKGGDEGNEVTYSFPQLYRYFNPRLTIAHRNTRLLSPFHQHLSLSHPQLRLSC